MLLNMMSQPHRAVATYSEVKGEAVMQLGRKNHISNLRQRLRKATESANIEWPQCVDSTNPIGCTECQSIIATEGYDVFIIPENTMVTADYREDRVRIFCNIEEGVVLATPKVG